MHESKKKRLEAAGWAVGNAEDFLSLSAVESEYIELKLRLAAGIRSTRRRRGLTQLAVAKRIGSSQSRVAKMESGDPSVTADLMVRALLAIGATPNDLARLIMRPQKATTPRHKGLGAPAKSSTG